MTACVCDRCFAEVDVLPITIARNKKRNGGKFICKACKYKDMPLRPQNTKEYWANNPEIREKISASLLTSEKFKASRITANYATGERNGSFGGMSEETKKKMSASRTGKLGRNATAWKGGKGSLLVRVKARIYKQFQWSKKIFTRDNYTCTSCGSTKKLDAHHTVPFATLLKEIKTQTNLQGDGLIDWLANQPTLNDAQGITLCRECHRAVHQNWGSHDPKIQND